MDTEVNKNPGNYLPTTPILLKTSEIEPTYLPTIPKFQVVFLC